MDNIKYRETYSDRKRYKKVYVVVSDMNREVLPEEMSLLRRDLFTGVYDSEGNEIYENDLLSYVDTGSITNDFDEEIVEWNEKLGHFCTESTDHVWAEVARKSTVVGQNLLGNY